MLSLSLGIHGIHAGLYIRIWCRNMRIIDFMLEYAKHLLGTPYIWGGQDRNGCDCSGFVLMCLNVIGLKPEGDHTAQSLHDMFSSKKPVVAMPGSLLFYGDDEYSISHVAIYLGSGYVIEAGGGGRECKTAEDAFKSSACVRIVKHGHRGDLVATLHPY
jgi:cell wall-associated NlpC family hydrolase